MLIEVLDSTESKDVVSYFEDYMVIEICICYIQLYREINREKDYLRIVLGAHALSSAR